ncbi:MAG: hypothetical protein U1D55_01750 [Phycisphaerae bacterium]
MLGAEVWVALAAAGEAPPLARFAGMANGEERLANSEENGAALPGFRFLSVSTSGTLQTDFTTAEAGKTAYYALRWLNTRGETGPWSEIAAPTVAA